MVIEINKDIDRYQESVAMGLTAKQLVFSIASVIVGGGIVLLLYRYIGLTETILLLSGKTNICYLLFEKNLKLFYF